MIKARNKTILQVIFLFSILSLFQLFLPSYDEDNGFYNMIFDDYDVYSSINDGKTPLHIAIIKKFLNNEKIEFEKNETIGGLNASRYVTDLKKLDSKMIPRFPTIPNYLVYIFLIPFNSYLNSDLFIFKALILFQITMFNFLCIIFYFFCIELKINNKFAFLGTLIFGLSTAVLVFSRYAFINTTFFLLLNALFLFYLIKLYPNYTLRQKIFLFLLIFSSIFFGVLEKPLMIIYASSFFLGLNFLGILKFTKFKYEYLLIFFLIVLLALPGYSHIEYIDGPPLHTRTDTLIGSKFYIYKDNNVIVIPIFTRIFSLLFGERGVVSNSIYLIFALPGLVYFYQKKKNISISIISIFLIYLFLMAISPYWYGGGTPRCDRIGIFLAFILSFFAIYFIQEIFKKRKGSNVFLILIFLLLVVISYLNIMSLAIRRDLVYLSIVDVFSFETVLWPYVEIEESEIKYDLSLREEQINWQLSWEDGCNPPHTQPKFTFFGIETGPCNCVYHNNASREFLFKKYFETLGLEVCSNSAGMDGILGFLVIDTKNYNFVVPSKKCDTYYFNVSEFADGNYHSLKLYSEVYGECNDEFLYFRKILFKKNSENITFYNIPYNLVGERKNWYLGGEHNCLPDFISDGLFIDKCLCIYDSYATKIFENKVHKIDINACAERAGDDKVILKIIANGDIINIQLLPMKCKKINLNFTEGITNITFSVKPYGNCEADQVLIKELLIKE